MILKDYYDYLISNSGSLSISSIYYIQAPEGVVMPWIVVEVPSGIRSKLTYSKMQGRSWLRVTCDVGPSEIDTGATTINQIVSLTENYRGDLGNTKDVHMSCSEPRSWPGTGGAYRYQVDIEIIYTYDYIEP
ncbi:MAG: hypothetical protein WC554_19115 [Clostridia bacterium]|jgi:hypothetical protein